MKQWHFFDKVYRRWLILVICTYEDFVKELEWMGYIEIEQVKKAKGMCVSLLPENNTTGQNCELIWMSSWESGTLIHELSHLVMASFDEIGVPISRDNTEGFAFYLEYWWTEINRVRRRYPDGRTAKLAKY